jgi:hypothetical protein
VLAAADQAALDAWSVPLPVPRAVTLSASPDEPFTYQLRADIAPHYTLRWSLARGAQMPPAYP